MILVLVDAYSVRILEFGLVYYRDKSVSGHSVTVRETIAVSSAEINGATAYEVSGTGLSIYVCV